MKGLALVVGAGGIGTQLAKDLNESEKDLNVVLCGLPLVLGLSKDTGLNFVSSLMDASLNKRT